MNVKMKNVAPAILFSLVVLSLSGCSSVGYSIDQIRYPAGSTDDSTMLMTVTVSHYGQQSDLSEKYVKVYVFPPDNPKSPYVDDKLQLHAKEVDFTAKWVNENNIEIILFDVENRKEIVLEYSRPRSGAVYTRKKLAERAATRPS